MRLLGFIGDFSVGAAASGRKGVRPNAYGASGIQLPRFGLMALFASMLEGLSEQNDNLVLPIWGWCVGVIMAV